MHFQDTTTAIWNGDLEGLYINEYHIAVKEQRYCFLIYIRPYESVMHGLIRTPLLCPY